jgi:DNA-binding transcriptional MerR regulator
MSSEVTTYDLKTLCALGGVTVRTVRFYIQQGLLPSPGLGAGARYTQEHLDRLLLIRRLQRAHLPLAEIRRRIPDHLVPPSSPPTPSTAPPRPAPAEPDSPLRLSDYGVHQYAAETRLPPLDGDESEAGSAADYIRDVLRERGVRHQPWHEPPRPPTPRPVTQRSQWERIEIADDVELHVRRPLTRDANRRLEKLLQAARHIFEEEP